MGFSVTASHLIFAIALLAAGGTAANSYWKIEGGIAEAKRTADETAVFRVQSAIAFSGSPSWNNGNDRSTFVIENTGATVLRISEFEYIVDGTWTDTVFSTTPSGATDTDLLMPGETVTIVLSLDSQPSKIRVVAENGAAAQWG